MLKSQRLLANSVKPGFKQLMELCGKTSLNLTNVLTWKPNHLIIKVNNFVQSMTVLLGELLYSSSESDVLHCILVYVKKELVSPFLIAAES